MNNKRHSFNVFNLISVLFLAAALLSACGGFNFQAQALPSEDGGIGISGGVDPVDPMQPESAQTGPTGQPIAATGIILLLVGFGVLVLILLLLARRNTPNQNSA